MAAPSRTRSRAARRGDPTSTAPVAAQPHDMTATWATRPPAQGALRTLMRQAQSVRIRYWGTRGSVPTPGPSTVRYGGNTSCVEVRTEGGTLLVLDCGTG